MKDAGTERRTDMQTEKLADGLTVKEGDRQMDGRTRRWTDRQSNRQKETDREIDRPTEGQ